MALTDRSEKDKSTMFDFLIIFFMYIRDICIDNQNFILLSKNYQNKLTF